MSSFLEILVRLNLAATLAIFATLALRAPIRRMFGAQLAYSLWIAVPLACIVMFLPSPDFGAKGNGALPFAAVYAFSPVPLPPWSPRLAGGLWAGGLLLSLVLAWRRHRRFAEGVSRRIAGPAVFGMLRPQIVLPFDFA